MRSDDATPPTDAGHRPEIPRLSGGWLVGAWALVILALALAAGSFINSFSAVRDAVEPYVGDHAWTIPVLIDVAVGVFSGIDLLFTKLGMRLPWLRLVPWGFTGATVWLKVAGESNPVGIVAHAAPPILWVVTVELAAHAIRVRGGLDAEKATRRATGRMDKVRLSRWLLAPWSTLVIRRWMILQEDRSYERTLARWWARKEAKWELQDSYGPMLWRLRAPRRARGLYRVGHLAPSTAGGATQTAPTPGPAPSAVRRDGPGAVRKSRRRGGTRRPPRGKQRAGFAEFAAVAAELESEGLPINRTLIGRRLRDRGLSVANDRADEYLARLLADRPRQGDGEAA